MAITKIGTDALDDGAITTAKLASAVGTDILASPVITGNLTTDGTIDGRDIDTDGTKLDTIETSATADQTGAEIKTAYEGETNAFTDTQFTKLGGIEASADVTDTTNVTAAGALMDSELADIAAVKAYTGIPDTNITYTTATRVIASSTGTDATLPRAGTTTDGLMRARLNGTTAYLTYNGTTA